MSPDPTDRERLRFFVDHDVRRGAIIAGFLIAAGAPLVIATALGRAGHGSDRVAAIVIGVLAIAIAIGFAVRLVRARAIAQRLSELAARPDLIVWIYEQELSYGGRTISNIYVCSRRGERLRMTAHGPRRDEAIALLGRLAPAAPRGFSRARDAAFEHDPLSVAST